MVISARPVTVGRSRTVHSRFALPIAMPARIMARPQRTIAHRECWWAGRTGSPACFRGSRNEVAESAAIAARDLTKAYTALPVGDTGLEPMTSSV
jgi:hypothetical protein